MTLNELLNLHSKKLDPKLEPKKFASNALEPKTFQVALKKAFMPYSSPIDVEGREQETLTILLNLSRPRPQCDNYLDAQRAKAYFSDSRNVKQSEAEIKWFHTHNLKFPDCRVKNQRLIAPPHSCQLARPVNQKPFGWAHNSATYSHTIWLLNTFIWQGKVTCLMQLILDGSDAWVKLLDLFGLTQSQISSLLAALKTDLTKATFPDEVSNYSKQVRFPYLTDYISMTPVASHAVQVALEQASRQSESGLKFTTLSLPNPASIGNLCASTGGKMKLLYYPIGARHHPHASLLDSRQYHDRYFDNFQITNPRLHSVLEHLAGIRPLKSQKERTHVRQHQVKILRKQIALWLIPLIEVKDRCCHDGETNFSHCKDEVAREFLYCAPENLLALTTPLNQKIHTVFQKHRYAKKFAYHPQLLHVIKSQIVWLLNQLSKPEEITETVEDQFILLSSMQVDQLNAISCPYLVGAPSLTGIWGFMHRFQIRINEQLSPEEKLEFFSFAFFVRDELISAGSKLSEPNTLAKKRQVSHVKRPTIRTEFFSDLEFDLIIRVRCKQSLSPLISELKAALPTTFSGGAIFPPPLERKIEWLKIINGKSSLFHLIKSLPRSGHWVSPTQVEFSSFDELGKHLSNDDSLLPVSSGFQFLECPKERYGSTANTHAYVENRLSIAKRINPIEHRFHDRDHFFARTFWVLINTDTSIDVKQCEA